MSSDHSQPEPTPNLVPLRGCAMSGYGMGSWTKVTASPISEFFGQLQAQGTLNVALDKPVRFNLDKAVFTNNERYYWAAEINGSRCLIKREKKDPLHLVEILSPHILRKKFHLKDGSSVEIKVPSDSIQKLSWETKVIWSIFWQGRSNWHYRRTYRVLIGPLWLLRRRACQSVDYRPRLWSLKKLRADTSICHINLARNRNLRGGERQTELLVEALATEGIPRQGIIVLQRGPLANRLQNSANLEVCRVRNRLSALFACRGASLLHAHEAHAAQVAYAAARLFGARYLITRRLTKPVRSNPYSTAVYRNAQTVVALTEAIEESLRGHFPITRIPDAWNPEPADPDAIREIKEKFASKFLIGHVAAMDGPEKGHAVLLEAARILQQDSPGIQFLLLGSGSLEEKLQRQARDVSNVYFAGWVDNPVTWIRAFDLFAFPSLVEPLGSSLLDALHAGVPVVASRVDGIPEIVTDRCGVLVPPGDAKALAKQLGQLYQSRELRQSLSEKGMERAKQYSPELMARKYMEIYRDLGLT